MINQIRFDNFKNSSISMQAANDPKKKHRREYIDELINEAYLNRTYQGQSGSNHNAQKNLPKKSQQNLLGLGQVNKISGLEDAPHVASSMGHYIVPNGNNGQNIVALNLSEDEQYLTLGMFNERAPQLVDMLLK
jgi:hypothetical protein